MEQHEIKYHSPRDMLDAANSSETSAEELDAIIKCNLPFISQAVAQNSNTTLDTLKKLIPEKIDTWNDATIACVLADNPKSDQELLQNLAQKLPHSIGNGRLDHEAFRAGIRICCNIKTPIELITGILSSSNTSVQFRKVLARESTRMDVLAILANDSSSRVKRKAALRISQR